MDLASPAVSGRSVYARFEDLIYIFRIFSKLTFYNFYKFYNIL